MVHISILIDSVPTGYDYPRIRYFLPLAFVTTCLCGLIYLTGQQSLRQNANDPQIQISEDVASRLSSNPTLPIPPTSTIDMGKSLSTFIIILNAKGKVIFSTVKLDGKTPALPNGVIDFVKTRNQARFTWQPKPGVRSAAVMTAYSGKTPGYVLVGRSLREVEFREDQLLGYVVFTWIIIMFGAFIVTVLFVPKPNKSVKDRKK